MGRLEPLLNRLDASKKERGDEFERLCKWFLENDPIYATQLEKVWLWDEWRDRWGPDAGIDLVARTKQGELWAIQAKHYAPESTVSKADIDSFLSESSRPGFVFRLLIATTDRLSANARRTLDGQKVPAQALLRSQLVQRELVWPDKIGKKPKPRDPYDPLPHQETAIEDVTKGFAKAERGQMIMACGTGKTLTSLFIAEELAAKRVLVLVPSLSLLSQTLTAWTANAKQPIEFLPVCSDETVDRDAAVESTSELGFPVTTDPAEIAAFVRRRGDTMRVVFATYQSSGRIEDAQKLSRVPKFDLVIADEAHRCTGNTTSDFATVLDAGKLRSERRLFMTATPRILSARAKRSAVDADVEFASMDDEDTFGPVFHRLTFATAIEQDLLADYQVVILGVDNEEVLKAVQERQLVTTNGKDVISADRLGAAVGLAKAIRKYGLTRLITFHGRVKAASNFADTFPAILDWMPARQRPKGVTEANFVSGEMSTAKRSLLLDHLKTSKADQVILANARVLTEGIDVPDLDGVAFMDPRNSEVDIVQAVGRAIRKPREKNKDKIGTIVLPIVIQQTEDPDSELDRTDYKAIWAVLRALRAQDERLGEELDALRRALGRKEGIRRSPVPDRVLVDLPRHAGAAFVQALSTRIVESSSASWEEGFGHLELFIAEHGHAQPSSKTVHNGYRLGQWVSVQRTRRATLDGRRCEQLDGTPGWVWNHLEAAWEEGFNCLRDFVAEHGHAQPPRSLMHNEYRLGQWVGVQRSNREQLSAFRREQLGALPGWAWNIWEAGWEDGFEALKAYVAEHGHARIDRKKRFRGFALGQWVSTQRGERADLAPQRREKLELLPEWSWDPRAAAWETGLSHLQGFVLEFGHARPPARTVVSGFRLGGWVSKQRAKKESLQAIQRERLEALPGWVWDPLVAAWEEGFSCISSYVRTFGDARPRYGLIFNNYHLGSWVTKQRSKRATLDADRLERLEALPGWTWDARGARWEEGFAHLEDYVMKYGHARPSQQLLFNGYRLGQWVGRQRAAQMALDPNQQERLEKLPGWVWHSGEAAWEEAFARLSAYVQHSGSAGVATNVLVDGYRLGAWVTKQRGKQAALDAHRRERLESLPGWTWDARG